MVEYFCKTLVSLWPPALACYLCAAAVGIITAIIELLSRYGKGNQPAWVLWGPAQWLYYGINGVTAAAGLFASEALDKTQIVDAFRTKPALAILQAAGIGLAAMFALRSSLVSVETKEDHSRVELGPAQILNVLNRYLHRQIDKRRGAAALREVISVMADVDPELIYPDILLCLTVTEAIPPIEVERIKKNIEVIMTNKKQFKQPRLKAVAIGLEIQKELGSDALGDIIKILKETFTVGVTASAEAAEQASTGSPSQPSGDPLDLLDNELQAALDKLRR